MLKNTKANGNYAFNITSLCRDRVKIRMRDQLWSGTGNCFTIMILRTCVVKTFFGNA